MMEEIDGMKGYRMSEIENGLTEQAMIEFNLFIMGQTVMVMDDGDEFIYYYDFDRFIYHYKGDTFK